MQAPILWTHVSICNVIVLACVGLNKLGLMMTMCCCGLPDLSVIHAFDATNGATMSPRL